MFLDFKKIFPLNELRTRSKEGVFELFYVCVLHLRSSCSKTEFSIALTKEKDKRD